MVEVVDARTQSTAGESRTTGPSPHHQASTAHGVHDGEEEEGADEDLLGFEIQRVAAISAGQRSLSSTTRTGALASIGTHAMLSVNLEEGGAAPRGGCVSHHSPGGLPVRCYDMLESSEDEGDSLGDVLDDGAKEDDSSADEQRPTSSTTKKGHQGRPKRSKVLETHLMCSSHSISWSRVGFLISCRQGTSIT